MKLFTRPEGQPIIWFLYGGLITTALCGLVYLCVQQSFRQNLNDPQIQMAEDGANILNAGGVPADVVPRGSLVDIGASLTPWIAIYDQSGKSLESSGELNNAPPQPPKALFDPSTWREMHIYGTAPGKETRVTWQSESGVRQALILVQASNGYMVVAGRNMREIEGRIETVGGMIFFAWLVTIGALLVLSLFFWFVRKE